MILFLNSEVDISGHMLFNYFTSLTPYINQEYNDLKKGYVSSFINVRRLARVTHTIRIFPILERLTQ